MNSRTAVSSPRRGRAFIGTSLAVGAMLALSACGGEGSTSSSVPSAGSDWASVVEAAKDEGQLMIYASQDGSDVLFKEGFEEAYPEISVTVNRVPTGDLLSQLDQEIDAGVQSADVAFHGQPVWFDQRAEDEAVAPIIMGSEAAPEYAEYEGETSIPFSRYGYEFAYNTDLVDEAPTTIEEVRDIAEETGVTVGYLDPRMSISITSQYEAYEEANPGITEGLAALPNAMYSSTTPMAQALASGEIGIIVGMIPGVIPPLAEQGAPVETSTPSDEHIWGAQNSAGALANAPHPNAAQVFMNWLMTEDPQRAFVEEMPPFTTMLVENPDMPFDNVQVYEPEEWPQERWDEFLANWRQTFGI